MQRYRNIMTHWVIDQHMLRHSTSEQPGAIVKALKRLGLSYSILEYIPFHGIEQNETFENLKSIQNNEAVVCYGTIEFLQQMQKHFNFIPGPYYNKERFEISTYIHKYNDINIFLNSDYILLPFGKFKKTPFSFFENIYGKDIFIKPNTGFKSFAGKTINRENYSLEVKTIDQFSSANDETLCVISGAKNISKEYRFIIAENKVITGSQYMENHNYKPNFRIDPEALSFAQNITDNEWQPDLVFTCDIGQQKNGEYKVVEFNSFSASGLYFCDIEKIIAEVSISAEKEYNGEISIIS